MILWLDDLRPPWRHGYIGADWAKTADEAIKLLKTGLVTFASLDHDLTEAATMGKPAPGEKTGMTVVEWLRDHPHFWPRDGVRVHSMNREGKELMEQVLNRIRETRRLKIL